MQASGRPDASRAGRALNVREVESGDGARGVGKDGVPVLTASTRTARSSRCCFSAAAASNVSCSVQVKFLVSSRCTGRQWPTFGRSGRRRDHWGRRSVLPGLPVRGDWPAWNGGRDEGAGQVLSRGRCRVDRVRSTAPVAAPTGSLLLGQGRRRVAMPPIRARDASARSVADRIEGSRSRCREVEFWTHYGTRNSR